MEEATGRYRPSGARIALAVGFAVVALAAFVLLVDVRFNPGDPIFEGITDADGATRKGWTVLLIAAEAMCFAGILMLLLIRPSSAGWSAEEWSVQQEPSGTRVQIGCPGCGTVFEKDLTEVDEPHEQDFSCPNCGRAGHLRTGLHRAIAIKPTTCLSCQREFMAYRPDAECPHCHAAQT